MRFLEGVWIGEFPLEPSVFQPPDHRITRFRWLRPSGLPLAPRILNPEPLFFKLTAESSSVPYDLSPVFPAPDYERGTTNPVQRSGDLHL
jgi:hypothetical protein